MDNNSSLSTSGGSRDGAVVRALASHQCGPGLIPGLGVICGLSLLLVLVLALRGFSPGSLVFPSPQKPTFPNSNSIWNPRATGLWVVRLLSVTLIKQSWFIYFRVALIFKRVRTYSFFSQNLLLLLVPAFDDPWCRTVILITVFCTKSFYFPIN